MLGVVGAQVGEAQFVKLGFRPQLRLVVGQAAPGGQGDKEEVTFTGKADAVGQGHLFPLHGTDGGVLHVIPIADNVRVGLPPVLHNHRQLLLWYAALQGAHVDEGPNAALIAASQRCHLALGAQIGAGAALLDVILGHMKHLGGGGLIDKAVPPEHVQHPFFICQPRQYTGLDGGVVAHNEAAPLGGDEGGADELGQHEGRGAEGHFQQVELSITDQLAGSGQVRELIPGEVLHLYQPSGPPAGPAGAIELENVMHAAVLAQAPAHGLILLYGGLGKLLAKLERPPGAVIGGSGQQLRHRLLVQAGHLQALGL